MDIFFTSNWLGLLYSSKWFHETNTCMKRRIEYNSIEVWEHCSKSAYKGNASCFSNWKENVLVNRLLKGTYLQIGLQINQEVTSTSFFQWKISFFLKCNNRFHTIHKHPWTKSDLVWQTHACLTMLDHFRPFPDH